MINTLQNINFRAGLLPCYTWNQARRGLACYPAAKNDLRAAPRRHFLLIFVLLFVLLLLIVGLAVLLLVGSLSEFIDNGDWKRFDQ